MSPNPLRIPLEVSQIRHNGPLLDALSCIFNTRNAYIYKEDKGNQANNEMSRLSSKVWCAKCQGFNHIFSNCTYELLVIQEHIDMGQRGRLVFGYMNSILGTLMF